MLWLVDLTNRALAVLLCADPHYLQVDRAPKFLVGLVKSLWVKSSLARRDYYALVRGFEAGDVDPHYQMRQVKQTVHHALVHTKVSCDHIASCFVVADWHPTTPVFSI
jgi:hypothetical protein